MTDQGISLVIDSEAPGRLGEYSCLAKNTLGSHSVLFTVLGERKIIVTEPPMDLVVAPGQTASLRCGGASPLASITYHWFKGRQAKVTYTPKVDLAHVIC